MAVAAGNTLVLKAAEDAPLGLLRVAELCAQHLPPGVLNLLTGYGEECGAALARHPLVRKLSFTGSTEVGKLIMHAAADRIVPVSLELGGKSPAIVFPDANDDRTVDGVISGMRFTRQGQSCTAGSRLFLHRSIFDAFLEKVSTRLTKLTIGDPMDEKTDMGAIINRRQFDRVCSYIEDGLQQPDARVVLVDADLRHPHLASYLGLPPTRGLSAYLLDASLGIDGVVQKTPVAAFSVVVAGPPSSMPYKPCNCITPRPTSPSPRFSIRACDFPGAKSPCVRSPRFTCTTTSFTCSKETARCCARHWRTLPATIAPVRTHPVPPGSC